MNELTISNQKAIAELANQHADANVFGEFLADKSANTLRSYATALDRFTQFLDYVQFQPGDMHNDPSAWQNITHGIVKAFREWLGQDGDSLATINSRLAVVRKYASLAFNAGYIAGDEHERIQGVRGINKTAEMPRKGHKKAKAVSISEDQAKRLKSRPSDPQGIRDTVIMCLLLDHGLRVGEVAALEVTDIDLASGKMTFNRPKVKKTQTHILSTDTRRALTAYLPFMPAEGKLLRSSHKGGALSGQGMTTQAITLRVNVLGKELGIDRLSAHDCRHYWATYWADKVSPFRLQEAGGWASLAMPRRYVEASKIANEGMVVCVW